MSKQKAVVYVGQEERVQLSPYRSYAGGDWVVRGAKFVTSAEHAKGLLESSNWQPLRPPRRRRKHDE